MSLRNWLYTSRISFYQVLKSRRGSEHLICLVYFEVARRLGIRCEMVVKVKPVGNNSSRYFIRWMEFPK